MNGFKDNSAAAESQQKITVTTPYGTLHIEDALTAQDHANMRAAQLEAFCVLVSGEGQQSFAALNDGLQSALLWMAQQSASELGQVLGQVAFGSKLAAAK